jgi:hypothetical protein
VSLDDRRFLRGSVGAGERLTTDSSLILVQNFSGLLWEITPE